MWWAMLQTGDERATEGTLTSNPQLLIMSGTVIARALLHIFYSDSGRRRSPGGYLRQHRRTRGGRHR